MPHGWNQVLFMGERQGHKQLLLWRKMLLSEVTSKVSFHNFSYIQPIERIIIFSLSAHVCGKECSQCICTSAHQQFIPSTWVWRLPLRGIIVRLASFKIYQWLEDEVPRKIFKFTDDTKLLWVIKCQADKDKLQKKSFTLVWGGLKIDFLWMYECCRIRKKWNKPNFIWWWPGASVMTQDKELRVFTNFSWSFHLKFVVTNKSYYNSKHQRGHGKQRNIGSHSKHFYTCSFV